MQHLHQEWIFGYQYSNVRDMKRGIAMELSNILPRHNKTNEPETFFFDQDVIKIIVAGRKITHASTIVEKSLQKLEQIE